MYFEYCLAAILVIILIALVVFVVYRKNNQLTGENRINLIICTVLAIACAILAPLLAKLLVNELYFSVFWSLFLSVVVFLGLSALAFMAYLRFRGRGKENSGESAITQSSATEPAISEAFSNAAITNEMAVLHEIESRKANETDHPEILSDPVETIEVLLNKAFNEKTNTNYSAAITYYEKALSLKPDDNLQIQIIIDICSLLKMTNQKHLAYEILKSEQYKMLNLEIKDEIIRNL